MSAVATPARGQGPTRTTRGPRDQHPGGTARSPGGQLPRGATPAARGQLPAAPIPAHSAPRAILLLSATAASVGLLLAVLLWLATGSAGAALVLGVVAAAAVAGLAWWGSAPYALHLLQAQPADPRVQARLFNLVEGLCANAGVAQPTLVVVPSPALNALTLGRTPHQTTLAVTQGLLDQLSRIELEAVLAHELTHIRSGDLLAATIAVGLFGVFAPVARAATGSGSSAVLPTLLVPLSALGGIGLRRSLYPHREETADRAGVRLTRYPPGLVAALEKMQRAGTQVGGETIAPTAQLWLAAPLSPPTGSKLPWLTKMYQTHPTLDERIEALREL